MKKYLSLALIFTAALTFFSCGGKDKKEEALLESKGSADAVEMVDIVNSVPEHNYWWPEAVSIYSKAGVFVENPKKDNKLSWVGSLTKGQVVGIAMEDHEVVIFEKNFDYDKEGTAPTKMAMVKIDGSGEFNPGETYYVVAANLVESALTFVVVGDNILRGKNYTFIYNENDLKKVTSMKVPAGTLVSCHNYEAPENGFFCCTFYIPEGEFKGYYKDKWLEADALSMDKSFIKAAQIKDRMDNLKERTPEVMNDVAETVGELDDSSEEYEAFINYLGLSDGR